ncbi:unnamed protein product [Adineta ricciae]|uniref:Carrier domain-containing protein n=1 Tax=Adineta ricciae TaxID=249248 RepID=A0A815Q373_ADIRI|nr:unnamed protein product [Adineta ricciae]CAF1504235.1 unnamed protein product [Adineta ricciae]
MDESNIGQQILLHSRENTVQENPEILQKVSMSDANTFWMNVLRDCELNRLLPLPYDRHRLLNENQTSHRALFSFDFGEDLTRYIFTYASSKNIPFRDIMIASFCAFLFKICNGERDLCIGMISHHESKEFKLIPDPSVNMIPLRCQLDPHWYFQQLAEHIHETVTKSMEYSYFPLQEILTPRDASKLAFLKICFKFHSYRKEMKTNCEKINCNDQYSTDCAINNTKSVATEVLDLIITIHHDLTMNRLSCTVDASRDVFNVETVDTITQRFHSMLQQVFLLPIYFMMTKPICELSITLPNERLLIQSTNNTSISLPSTNGVHRDFVCQTMKHPQKLAVELDEQFLTYCELLNCIQILSMNFLNEYRIVPGDIVCQCVERSFSMVIGILAIEMVGGVYCPLSPQDPEHRLHALMQQTQSRLVLVNYFTKSIFHDEISFINIDSVIMYDYATYEADTKALSNVIVTPNDIAYIIFTSGSTGTPKAARLRHRNITDWMNTALGIGVINKNDIVAQIARCSFDVHVLDILGTLIIGGSLVMLHPEGISDFEYLARVFSGKQTTYIHAVPSLLRAFFTFLTSSIDFSAVKYFRSVCASGEACSVKLLRFLSGYLSENCVIWNLYGPAEAIGCTFHRFDPIIDTEVVPIGFMMPNYRYEIFDEFLQHIVDNQEGELFIGGVGLYDGYLGRDDLTAAAFVKINSQLYYRTGDILKLTSKGSLLYHGRKDHQIKLHGQRIELGEIEQCILNTSAPFCLVTKWNDHHLIAYVEKSSNINEAQLREHCRKYLPPHMIPSIFILLEDLPLNTNGKVDRKRLPSPNFHHSLSVAENKGGLLLPKDEIEEFVHRVWCQLFHQNRMPMDTNFFAVGGHSLLLMELLWQYKAEYHLNSNTLTINDLSNNITIRDHARVVRHYLNMTPISVGSPLVSLYLTQGNNNFYHYRQYSMSL